MASHGPTAAFLPPPRQVVSGNADVLAHAGVGDLGVKPRSPSPLYLATGMMLLGMLVMVPIWNAVIMLWDPVFSYFCGTDAGHAIILVSVAVVVLYMMTITIVSLKQSANEQTALYVATFFVMALGLVYMRFDFTWFQQPRVVATQIWTDCVGGVDTSKVYQKSLELYALRRDPACFVKASVENCDGFQQDAESDVLKDMEAQLHCSGFCYSTNSTGATVGSDVLLQAAGDSSYSPPNSTDAVSLLQTIQTLVTQSAYRSSHFSSYASGPAPKEEESASAPVAANVLATSTSPSNAVQLPSQEEVDAAFPPNTMYPPTLFSQDDHKASCNGMAGRLMDTYGMDVGDSFFVEGVFLLGFSILIGSLMVLGACFATTHHKPIHGESASTVIVT